MSQEKTTWLSRLFTKVAAFFSGLDDKVHDATLIANNVGNAIVKAINSPEGQLLTLGLEMAVPAATGLMDGIKLALPVIITKVNSAATETSKTGEQQLLDGLHYLAIIRENDPDLFAAKMNSIVALVAKFFSDNQGLGASIQQILTTTQIVHNPQILDITPVTAKLTA